MIMLSEKEPESVHREFAGEERPSLYESVSVWIEIDAHEEAFFAIINSDKNEFRLLWKSISTAKSLPE